MSKEPTSKPATLSAPDSQGILRGVLERQSSALRAIDQEIEALWPSRPAASELDERSAEAVISAEFEQMPDKVLRRVTALEERKIEIVQRAFEQQMAALHDVPIGSAATARHVSTGAATFYLSEDQWRAFEQLSKLFFSASRPAADRDVFDAFVAPFRRFAVEPQGKPRALTGKDGRTVWFGVRRMVVEVIESVWTVVVDYVYDADIQKNSYVTFRADVESRTFKPPEFSELSQEQQEALSAIQGFYDFAKHFAGAGMAALSLFLLATNHRKVAIVETVDLARPSTRQQRRAQAYVDRDCFAIIIPPEIPLRRIIGESVRGRCVRRRHRVRGHLRRDRAGVPRIHVKPHERGLVQPGNAPVRPYDGTRLLIEADAK